MEFSHVPVLKNETVECLNVKEDGIYIDGTLGGGGHSLHILERLNDTGKLIGIDRDKQAIEAATKLLSRFNNFFAVNDNYENIPKILEELNIQKVDGVVLDLGVSSYQIDEASRGFSYMFDAHLDMRMNREDNITAYDVVNKYSKERLIDIFFRYGQEKYSKNIAINIIKKREIEPINTTLELVNIIEKSIPKKSLNNKGHPAKRIFQAIRIEVNNELTNLNRTIIESVKRIKPNGRVCVISFHSLEDRIVKKTFEDLEGRCICPSDFPKCVCGCISYGKIITKKPIIPSQDELTTNNRSKSAKLRVFEIKEQTEM